MSVRTRWQDDIDLRVYVSTDGDFVSLGTRTAYPFESGGPNGNPVGWTTYDSASTQPGQVNRSVGIGRYNISDNGLTSVNGAFYGAYRDFAVKANKRYIMQVQARVMDDKQSANRNIRYEMPLGSGVGSYSPAYSDWENVAIPIGSSGANTSLRIVLQGIYYNPIPPYPTADWGIQFTNLALIEQELTYPAPTWREVTCDTRSYSARFGRDRFVGRYDVASLQVSLRNNDGEFSYEPEGWLRPGRFIKVVGNVKGGNPIDQFYGIIDSLTDSYTLDGKVYSTFNCIDVSSLVAAINVPTSSWSSSTFLSGNRFKRLLDAVAWHPSMMQFDTGVFVQQAVMANGRSVRDELGLIADSEGGYFFANRSGQLEYHDRNWRGKFPNVRAELLATAEPEQLPLVEDVEITLPGVVGNNLRVSQIETPSFNMTPDTEIVARVSFDSMTGSHQTIAGRYTSTTNYNFMLRKLDTGNLELYAGGTVGVNSGTATLPYANQQLFWVRAFRIASTGEVRFFHAPDSESEPTTWTQLGITHANNNPGTPAATLPLPLIIGQVNTTSAMKGRLRRLILRNGVGGPIVFDIRRDDVYGNAGATEFRANTGQRVQVIQTTGQTILVDRSYYPVLLPPVDTVPTDPDAAVICTSELQTDWSRDRVINDVSLANQGGSAYNRVDADSQRKYGPRTYQRMDFLNVNTDASYLVTRMNDLMTGYTDAILRVNAVRFRPRGDSFKFALDVFLNELVRVRYIHPDDTWGFAVVSRVQGIEHSVTSQGWEVTLMLDQPISYTDHDGSSSSGWDSGIWDVNIWDQARDDIIPGDGAYWNSGQTWNGNGTTWLSRGVWSTGVAKWSDPNSDWKA